MCFFKEIEHLSFEREEEEIMYTSKDMKFEERTYGITLGELIGVDLVNYLLDSMTKETSLSKDEVLEELRIRNFGF